MSHPQTLSQVLDAAVAEGLLADATPPTADDRPWPVVAMTAVGAWVAALPMCAVVGLLFWPVLMTGAGSYMVGTLILAGALAVLRAPHTPLFLEQLAIPGLLVGKGLLTYSLFRDAAPSVACAGASVVALAAAALVPMAWMRVLLGMLAALWAGATLLVLGGFRWSSRHITMGWWVLHGLLLMWGLAVGFQREVSARAAAGLEAVGTGWLIVVLGGLAWITGATFLVGSLGAPVPNAMNHGYFGLEMRAVSAALALAASAWLPSRWPSLRRAPLIALPLVAVPLAWMMPSLGGVLLATVLCASTSRWRLAALGAVAAAWVIGALYYQLSWTLVAKAYVMVLAGAVLGAAAAQLRGVSAAPPLPVENRWRLPPALIAVAVVLTLAVANTGIWQKQQLIATGRVVLVPLGPVDPRSLMQGDYMALAFALPPVDPGIESPQVVLAVDPRGVARAVRVEPEHQVLPLAADELRVQLVRKQGRWMMVTDAWYFAEGEAERFSAARFGEFRVTADGRALLVGMRDANLQPIAP